MHVLSFKETCWVSELMGTWFEATETVNTTLDGVEEKAKDLGHYFQSVVGFMPGISSAVLLEAEATRVKIQTNEGIMIRSNITQHKTPSEFTVDFDEAYQAGSLMMTQSRHTNIFSSTTNGVTHKLIISNVSANGILGWLYRTFGASNIGKAILAATKTHLES